MIFLLIHCWRHRPLAVLNALLLIAGSTVAAFGQSRERGSRPEWLRQRPATAGFVVGIGSARLSSSSIQSPTAAPNRALAQALHDIATQLQVRVTGETSMQLEEDAAGLRESFDQQMHLRADVALEGFDIVDTWTSGDTCWVYARLDEVEFHERQRTRRAQLGEHIRGLLDHIIGGGSLAAALASGVNGLEQLRRAADDVSFDENEVQRWRHQLLTALRQRLSAVQLTPQIVPSYSTGADLVVCIEAPCGEKPDESCSVGLPVHWRFDTGAGELTSLTWTGSDGCASSRVTHLEPSVADPTVTAAIDLDAIGRVGDATALAELAFLPSPVATLSLSRPRLTARLQWRIPTEPRLDVSALAAVASTALAACGIDVVDDDDSRLRVGLEVSVRRRRSVGDIRFAFVDVVLTVDHAGGARLFHADARCLKGAGATSDEAVRDAFEGADSLFHEAAARSRSRLYPRADVPG